MGNMLLVLDMTHPDMNALDFACYLSKYMNTRLTIISLKKGLDKGAMVISLWPSFAKIVNDPLQPVSSSFHPAAFTTDHETCLQACYHRGVNAVWDNPYDTNFSDIIVQTRFADLLVIGAGTSLQGPGNHHLSVLVKSLLQKAECPVIIPPYQYKPVNRIVFAWNGSKSSAFAIKQFSYLFPQFSNKAVTVLEINKHYECKAAERECMQQWLENRYAQVDFQQWQGSTPFTLFRYFLDKDNLLLVMGSFGRSLLANVLNPGASTPVLEQVNVPVFITHH